MRESVQDWRNKWFYIRYQPTETHHVSFPIFKDVLKVKPKKTWVNTMLPGEKDTVEDLYLRVQAIRIVGGRMSNATEISALFLKHRIQPLMARVHPMWMYAGAEDPTR